MLSSQPLRDGSAKFLPGFPSTHFPDVTTLALVAALDRPGDLFYVVVVGNNATIPSVDEVVSGSGAGVAAVVAANGSLPLPRAGEARAATISGLEIEEVYSVFLVTRWGRCARSW